MLTSVTRFGKISHFGKFLKSSAVFGAVYFIIDEILNLLGQFLMNLGQYLAHKFCLFQI